MSIIKKIKNTRLCVLVLMFFSCYSMHILETRTITRKTEPELRKVLLKQLYVRRLSQESLEEPIKDELFQFRQTLFAIQDFAEMIRLATLQPEDDK